MAREAGGGGTVPKEADERSAIEAAQKDPARFAELYEDNFERVYAFVQRRVRDRQEAEDLTSEVFHRALANLSKFEWRGIPFSAWLVRIASNAIASRSERAAKEREILRLVDRDEADAPLAEPRARLFRLVADLPRDQRRVVALRFAEEKSIREIARELGRSEGAVKQLQLRALKGLRARMGETNG